MSRFPELTEGQREPLLAVVRYQLEADRETVFALDGSWQAAISPWREKDAEIVTIPRETAELWHHMGYALLSDRMAGQAQYLTFVLCELAIKYEGRMRKPRVVRGLLGMLDMWATDVRAAVMALVVTIVTALVLNWLGLLR